MSAITTKFFDYSQNNSGGNFVHDKSRGIGYHVVIEATDAEHANQRAESIGLYFYGCETGMDCSCCGDRWYHAWSDEDGTETPEAYGKPVTGGWGISSYIHYLDGFIEERKEK